MPSASDENIYENDYDDTYDDEDNDNNDYVNDSYYILLGNKILPIENVRLYKVKLEFVLSKVFLYIFCSYLLFSLDFKD